MASSANVVQGTIIYEERGVDIMKEGEVGEKVFFLRMEGVYKVCITYRMILLYGRVLIDIVVLK